MLQCFVRACSNKTKKNVGIWSQLFLLTGSFETDLRTLMLKTRCTAVRAEDAMSNA